MAQFDFATRQDLEQMKKEIINEICNQKPNPERIAPALKSKDVKQLLGCGDSKLQYLRDNGKIKYVDFFGTYYYSREQFASLLSAS